MTDDQQRLRASDADRQRMVERLRTALDDGRLSMDEFVERMGRAYEAKTYGELAVLQADLPAVRDTRPEPPVPAAPQPQPAALRTGWAGLPAPLKVLWTIWLTIVSINVVIWVLVSATAAQFIYPWPVWVAGPSGAALLAISAAVSQNRRHHRAGPGGSGAPGAADRPGLPDQPGQAGQ